MDTYCTCPRVHFRDHLVDNIKIEDFLSSHPLISHNIESNIRIIEAIILYFASIILMLFCILF